MIGGSIDSELRQLLDVDDPRTVADMKAADETYDEGKIVRVERFQGDDGFSVEWTSQDGGTCGIGLPDRRNPDKVEPEVGDTIRVYGRFGGDVHGIDLNGREAYWLTPLERIAERVRWLADHDREKRERFARNRDAMDAAYDALPEVLKLRIDRFRRERADFRVDSEAYEMAAVGDAPKIARALAEHHGWTLDDDLRVLRGTLPDTDIPKDVIEGAVKAFYDLPYEEQKRRVPDLIDGHSGNTFGGAVNIAAGLLTGAVADFERNGTAAS